MKPLFSALGLVVAATLGANAQINQETLTAGAVGKDRVPAAVISAYEKDFPEGKNIDAWKLLPAQVYADKYAIAQGGDEPDGTTQTDFYAVDLMGKGTRAMAVYDKTGKLRLFKENITNAILPAVVTNRLLAAYPNARITSDHEKIQLADGKKQIRYYVKFTQDGKRGSAWLDGSGQLLLSRQ